MWNRQRKTEVLLDVDDVAAGHVTRLCWNPAERWVWSAAVAHPPLIGEDAFGQAQRLLAGRSRGPRDRKKRRSSWAYLLRGAVYCGVCQRTMHGQRSSGLAYYRCRFPAEYALANRIDHPRNAYLREADPLDGWLAQVFDDDHREQTIDAMTAAQGDDQRAATAEPARAILADCTAKLARHRAALEAGADPAIVTRWIAHTQAQRLAAEADLRHATGRPTERMTRNEIAALVASLGDLLTAIRHADPADKAEIYRQLGLRLTYHPEHTNSASRGPPRPARLWGSRSCPRGDSTHNPNIAEPHHRVPSRSISGDHGYPRAAYGRG